MSRTLSAFCDLETCPVSYDFTTWLVRAMKERDARGCDRLHVVIVPKEKDALGGFARHWGNHDEAATIWRFWHICVASCPLARATVTIADSMIHAHRMRNLTEEHWYPEGRNHFMIPLVQEARRGHIIPKLRPTDGASRYVRQWLAGRKVVTLTVRRQSTNADRNSNLPAWDALADWIRDEKKLTPVVLSDSNDALAQGQGYAELDPDLRLALYEQAVMNMIGANGPSALMHCSDAPYLNFGVALNQGWRDHYARYVGLAPGEQLPWALPNQRMIYRPDDLAVMKEEFESSLACLEHFLGSNPRDGY